MYKRCLKYILWRINPLFSRLFASYRQVTYVLRTRSPVVSKKASFFLLPLDLHVLGLPLAFILSQDQTLHCISLNVCPTPGNPESPHQNGSFLILRCRYNMYMNFLSFFSFKTPLSVFQKRLALSAKRVQIYAPYFLTTKCFSIFFLKKIRFISKCLFSSNSFLRSSKKL